MKSIYIKAITIMAKTAGPAPETIVLGGGCFWCTEAVFLMLKGVRQ
ncbi:Peptide methionine sulfoxide reductase MsrA [uncultured archaeon]|nr:Peptide methionine sulfoxide reductase MsrA [uncultured archaeon]